MDELIHWPKPDRISGGYLADIWRISGRVLWLFGINWKGLLKIIVDRHFRIFSHKGKFQIPITWYSNYMISVEK